MKPQVDKTKYNMLTAEKNRLKLLLDHYNHLKGKPTHNAIVARHKNVVQQIRQLFKV